MSTNKHIEIGRKLKDYFSEKKMTQQDIADELGVTQTAVSALLRGKPFGKKTAKAWSEKFGFDFTWLLTGEGDILPGQTSEKEIEPELINQPGSDMVKALEELVKSNSMLVESNQKMVETNQKLVEKILCLTE